MNMKRLNLSRVEKWGLRFLLLFIAGWLALFVYIRLMGDNHVSLRQNDIKRQLNSEIFSSKDNIHLTDYVHKVKILRMDSISADGFMHYSFRFKIKSKEKGSSWHTGSVAEKDLFFKDLKYSLDGE